MWNEQEFKKQFKKYIQDEIKSPEVQEAKERFFDRILLEEKFFLFKPQVFIPIIAIALAMVALVWFRPVPAVQPDLQFGTVMRSETHVEVKRVSSKTGPTMVYQKVSEGVPITVIWVFNGGSV